MLDSTKANEFASQYGNDVYSEVKSCLNITSITSRFVLLFCVTLLESSKQFSHYYDFTNYIYFSCTPTAR